MVLRLKLIVLSLIFFTTAQAMQETPETMFAWISAKIAVRDQRSVTDYLQRTQLSIYNLAQMRSYEQKTLLDMARENRLPELISFLEKYETKSPATNTRKRPREADISLAARVQLPKQIAPTILETQYNCPSSKILESSGMTLLHWACEHQKISLAKELARINPREINAQDRFFKMTALHMAVQQEYRPLSVGIDLITVLLEKGADINAQDVDGNSVLHLADSKLFDFLIKQGAKIELKNNDGENYEEFQKACGASPEENINLPVYALSMLFQIKQNYKDRCALFSGIYNSSKFCLSDAIILSDPIKSIQSFNKELKGEFSLSQGFAISELEKRIFANPVKYDKTVLFGTILVPENMHKILNTLKPKDCFYLNAFIRASTTATIEDFSKINCAESDWCIEFSDGGDQESDPDAQMVVVEIDLSAFNRYSALIDEETCLIAPYNIFEFTGSREEAGKVVISLKMSFQNRAEAGWVNVDLKAKK